MYFITSHFNSSVDDYHQPNSSLATQPVSFPKKGLKVNSQDAIVRSFRPCFQRDHSTAGHPRCWPANQPPRHQRPGTTTNATPTKAATTPRRASRGARSARAPSSSALGQRQPGGRRGWRSRPPRCRFWLTWCKGKQEETQWQYSLACLARLTVETTEKPLGAIWWRLFTCLWFPVGVGCGRKRLKRRCLWMSLYEFIYTEGRPIKEAIMDGNTGRNMG